jgi:predicted Zn-dependent peptidase
MTLDIKPTEHFSLATVTQKKSDIVKAIITTDTHTHNSLQQQTIEHLYADILLSGCGNYAREGFLDAINMLGASIDIDVTEGKVTFTIRCTAIQLNKVLTLLQTMLQKPTMPATELKRVKSTALNQLHQAKEDSKNIALDELRNVFYGTADRKYTYSIEDCMNQVPKVTTAQLKKFHQSVLSNKWFCSIGGDKAAIATFTKKLQTLKTKSQEVAGIHQPKPPTATLQTSSRNVP